MNGSLHDAREAKATSAIPWASWLFVAACLLGYGTVEVLPVAGLVRAAFAGAFIVMALVWAVGSSIATMRFTSGKNHRLWRALAVALSGFLAAFAYRLYWIVRYGALPGVGSFEDIAFVVGFLAFVPVVLLMSESYEVGGLRKVRSVVDFLTILTAALALVYVGLALPLGLFDPAGGWKENVFFLAFPVMGVSYVAFLAAFKRGRWHTDEVHALRRHGPECSRHDSERLRDLARPQRARRHRERVGCGTVACRVSVLRPRCAVPARQAAPGEARRRAARCWHGVACGHHAGARNRCDPGPGLLRRRAQQHP